MKRLGFTAVVLSLGIGLAVLLLMDAGPSAVAHEAGDLTLTAPGIEPANMPLFSTTATDVAGGGCHSCAVTSSGNLRCWGRNNYGQLANGTTIDSTIPVLVTNTGGSPLAGIAKVAAGYYHACAVTTGGGKGWGKNNHGQLGNGEHGDDPRDWADA